MSPPSDKCESQLGHIGVRACVRARARVCVNR